MATSRAGAKSAWRAAWICSAPLTGAKNMMLVSGFFGCGRVKTNSRFAPARANSSSLAAAAPGRSGISQDQTCTRCIRNAIIGILPVQGRASLLYVWEDVWELVQLPTGDPRRTMERIRLSASSMLVADVQQGFTSLCPRELPVPGGLEIVPAVNRLLDLPWSRVDASQDWHPPDHRSFFGQ